MLLDKNGDLKISDFGLSALYVGDADAEGNARSELLHTTCGTPNYVAPEVLENHGYDGKKADVWSIGVIVYVLLAGYLPFEENTMVQLFVKIKSADFEYPSWFSAGVKELLNRILIADPEQRLSLSEVHEHTWVANGPAWSDEPARSSPSSGGGSGGHTTVDASSDIPLTPAVVVTASAGITGASTAGTVSAVSAVAAPSSSQKAEVLMPPVPPQTQQQLSKAQPLSPAQQQSPSQPHSESSKNGAVDIASAVPAKSATVDKLVTAAVKVETVPNPKAIPVVSKPQQQQLQENKPAAAAENSRPVINQREAPVAGNASGGCGCIVA